MTQRHADYDAIVPLPDTRTLLGQTVEVRRYGGLTIAQRGKFHQLLAESLELAEIGVQMTPEQATRSEYVEAEMMQLMLVDVDADFVAQLQVAQIARLTTDFLEDFATTQQSVVGDVTTILEQIVNPSPVG